MRDLFTAVGTEIIPPKWYYGDLHSFVPLDWGQWHRSKVTSTPVEIIFKLFHAIAIQYKEVFY